MTDNLSLTLTAAELRVLQYFARRPEKYMVDEMLAKADLLLVRQLTTRGFLLRHTTVKATKISTSGRALAAVPVCMDAGDV